MTKLLRVWGRTWLPRKRWYRGRRRRSGRSTLKMSKKNQRFCEMDPLFFSCFFLLCALCVYDVCDMKKKKIPPTHNNSNRCNPLAPPPDLLWLSYTTKETFLMKKNENIYLAHTHPSCTHSHKIFSEILNFEFSIQKIFEFNKKSLSHKNSLSHTQNSKKIKTSNIK